MLMQRDLFFLLFQATPTVCCDTGFYDIKFDLCSRLFKDFLQSMFSLWKIMKYATMGITFSLVKQYFTERGDQMLSEYAITFIK